MQNVLITRDLICCIKKGVLKKTNNANKNNENTVFTLRLKVDFRSGLKLLIPKSKIEPVPRAKNTNCATNMTGDFSKIYNPAMLVKAIIAPVM